MVLALKQGEDGYLSTGSGTDLYTFNPERKLRFLALAAEFWPDMSRCAAAVGIHITTFYNHMKSDVKFCNEIKAIKAAKLDELERVAIESGRDQRKGFLDRAMILRAHRPELYDRAKVVKLEGCKMQAGERGQRMGAVDVAVDAEIVKTYLDIKQRREAKQQQQLTTGEASAGERKAGENK